MLYLLLLKLFKVIILSQIINIDFFLILIEKTIGVSSFSIKINFNFFG